MAKRTKILSQRDIEVRELNRRLSKKKSNIKSRHNIIIDIPRIDPKARGEAYRVQKRLVESFLNPNNTEYQYIKNEKGVSLSKKYVNATKREMARINRIKKREFERLANMDYIDRETGESLGKLGEIKLVNVKQLDEFKPLNVDFNVFTSNDGLKRYYENKKSTYAGNFIKKQRIQYQNNYIKSIENHFGEGSDVQPLIDYIRTMSPDEFYLAAESTAGVGFSFLYDERDRDNKLEGIYHAWGMDLEDELIKQAYRKMV